MLIALCSAKGSPGVTTSALALALGWPRRVVLAECDPAGGDVLSGYGQGQARPGSQGLTDLMAAARSGAAELELWTHLVTLDSERRAFVLPGVPDARSARVIDWPRLVTLLAGSGADILADCGRLRAEHSPRPMLHAADLVLLVCRATLRSVRAAQTAAAELASDLASRGTGADALGVLLINPGAPFGAPEVEKALSVPVLATLPGDARVAAVLSDGAPPPRGFASSSLLKAGKRAGEELSAVTEARRARLGLVPQVGAVRARPARVATTAPVAGPPPAALPLSPSAAGTWGEAITSSGRTEPSLPRWREPATLHGPGEVQR